jgi:D-aminoacyl-tRNA deacylase
MNSYYTLVASKEDPASDIMAEYLINHVGFSINKKNYAPNRSSLNHEKYDFSEYRYGNNITLHVSHSNSLLYLEELDEKYPGSEAFIFLSRHSSESGIPTLTCHFTGNFSASNPYGGNPRELGICFPSFQKEYVKEINMVRSQVPEYEITIEATHHGPTSLKKPTMFIEIGSTPRQWVDKHAASIVCDTLISLVSRKKNTNNHCKSVGIALGGTHYPAKFNQLLLESDFGLAAVAAKHSLTTIDESMMEQMISKSIEKVTHAIVDRRGLGKEKHRILELIAEKDLELLEV